MGERRFSEDGSFFSTIWDPTVVGRSLLSREGRQLNQREYMSERPEGVLEPARWVNGPGERASWLGLQCASPM